MRKFRNAALAVATATTVAISGVSVAAAEDGAQGSAPAGQEQGGLSGSSDLKNKILKGIEWDSTSGKTASGEKIANWLKGEDENKELPIWAKIFVGGGIAAAAASVLGLIVAPAYNFLKYNGFLG